MIAAIIARLVHEVLNGFSCLENEFADEDSLVDDTLVEELGVNPAMTHPHK